MEELGLSLTILNNTMKKSRKDHFQKKSENQLPTLVSVFPP